MPNSTAQQLPPLLGFEHVAAAWSEAGRFTHGAHGIIPLQWSELAAYQQLVSPALNGFELSMIRRMSESFCDEMNASEDRPQPYIVGQPIKTTAERLVDAAASRERASFGAR